MASVTTWTRLEPRPRSADMRPSLEARVHDPLWLLARQWQLGEFLGEDAGSPVSVRLRADAAPLSTVYAATTVDYDAGTPLEVVVEREAGTAADLRVRAEGGSQFLRRLSATGMVRYAVAFTDAYPLDPEDMATPDVVAYLGIMAGRVPDGRKLRDALAAGALPGAIAPGDTAAVVAAARGWYEWYATLSGESESGTWRPERMEYSFAVGARVRGRDVRLTAAEYADGRLDWDDFDADINPQQVAASPTEAIVQTTLPAPVRYGGMPAARWWQFEDARVDFGGIEAAPADLARMLVAEFASTYGNDWYLMPVELPAGSVTVVGSLVVTDTFGERTLIAPAEDADWSLFRLAATDGSRFPGLYLAPAVASALESEPLEDVLLIRDELANLAWAVERTVENEIGRPVDRAREVVTVRSGALAAAYEPAAALAYELAATVPGNWIPLLPEEVAPGDIRLRRGAMEQLRDGVLEPVPPRGRLLEPGRELVVYEEEVPRSGARVTRTYQYTRGPDGEGHLWIGRRKGAGLGEGSSGLRFDSVVSARAQPAAYAGEVTDVRATTGWGGPKADLSAVPPGARLWVVVSVRNTGSATWRRDGPDAVTVATVLPRGHASPLATAEWLAADRPAALREPQTGPDAVGTFAFPISCPLGAGPFIESFNLVAGAAGWLAAGSVVQVSGTVAAGPIPEAGWRSLGGAVVAPVAAESELLLALGLDGIIYMRRSDWTSLDGTFDSAPVVVRLPGGLLEICARAGANLRAARQTEPGGTFGAWRTIADGVVGRPAGIVTPGGDVVVFARLTDGSIGFGDGPSWRTRPGPIVSDPVTGMRMDGGIEVFARTPGGAVHAARRLATGDLGDWRDLGGDFAYGPTAVTGPTGIVLLAAVAGGAVSLCRQDPATGDFDPWQDLGGRAASAPAAARHADGRIEVVVATTTGGVEVRRETIPGGAFEAGWLSLDAEAAGTPATATLADGRLLLVLVAGDGTVHRREQRSPGGPWDQEVQDWRLLSGVQLGVRSTLGVDAVVRPSGR